MFHKSCLPHIRSQISFVKDNKIICCKDESFASELDKENSLLEQTISELNEGSAVKNRYIEKLKHDNKLFMEEAMKQEDEMCQVILKQETIIKELEGLITELRKNTQVNKQVQTISTQTSYTKHNKNESTSAEILIDKTSGVVNKILQNTKTKTKETTNIGVQTDYCINNVSTNTLNADVPHDPTDKKNEPRKNNITAAKVK